MARNKTPKMLKRLRVEFVAITMALVGVVLGVSFFTNYAYTENVQKSLTEQSLDRVLNNETTPRRIRSEWREFFDQQEENEATEDENDEQLLSDAAVIKVFVTTGGTIIDANDAYDEAIVTTDVDALVNMIMGEEGEEGVLEDLHIAWKRKDLEGFGSIVVLVDTTQRDEALKSQAMTSLLIFLGAMLALFAATWWLSSWALRPVEDAWDRQKRFIADASHELKTPLTVILANTQILQGDTNLPGTAMRWVDSTSEEAFRMNELVTELLELARADEATQSGSSAVLALADIDFSEMVEAATLEFDAVAFECGCFIESSIQPGIHVMGDRSWLERAVKVLLDNATKYADRNTLVQVSLRRDGKRVVYSVNNRGTVISQNDLDHIFDRFYRSDRARSRSDSGGFGLGLAIAKSVVEAHGGTISATSNALEGTTFTITL